jgi:hypothetical protein
VNSLGSTLVTLEFDLNRSLDGASIDVQSAITQASRLLPQGMPTPPTFTKVNPADQPILYLVITSTTLPPWTLDEYAALLRSAYPRRSWGTPLPFRRILRIGNGTLTRSYVSKGLPFGEGYRSNYATWPGNGRLYAFPARCPSTVNWGTSFARIRAARSEV